MLALRGIRLKYLQKEKLIRQTVESVLVVVPNISLTGLTINVTLLGENVTTIHVRVQSQQVDKIPKALAQSIATHVQEQIHFMSEVTLEIIPVQIYSTL